MSLATQCQAHSAWHCEVIKKVLTRLFMSLSSVILLKQFSCLKRLNQLALLGNLSTHRDTSKDTGCDLF